MAIGSIANDFRTAKYPSQREPGFITDAAGYVSGGPRGGFRGGTPGITGLQSTTPQAVPGAGFGTAGDIAGVAGLGLGLASLLGFGQSQTDFDPYLTPERAIELTETAGQRALSRINQRANLAQQQAASQYVGRGLGSAGAPIGDIVGIGLQAGEAAGGIEADLNQQLAAMLAQIDQQQAQMAALQAQEERDIFGTLGDIGLSAAFLLL